MGVKVETTMKEPSGSGFRFRTDHYPDATGWSLTEFNSFRIEYDAGSGSTRVAEYPGEKVFRVFQDSAAGEREQPAGEQSGGEPVL